MGDSTFTAKSHDHKNGEDMKTLLDLAYHYQIRSDYVVTPTVTASSAYAAGNAVGGLITIANSAGVKGPIGQADLSAVLKSFVMIDKANQKKAYTLFLFNDLPTTPVDKTAYAPTAADLLKLIGVLNIAAADWVTINSLAYLSGPTYQNLGIVCKPAAIANGGTMYGALITGTSGTPTFASTSDLQLRLQFTQGT